MALTTDWSEHPSEPLKELEVFIGFILNRTGVQTHRQRDRSLKLKDAFDRITSTIVREFRKASLSGSPDGRLQTVELCLAGIRLGRGQSSRRDHRWSRNADWHVHSFKVVAASALMRELNAFANENRIETRGGGFPGVQGLPMRTVNNHSRPRPVNAILHRQQTPEIKEAANQLKPTPGPVSTPQLTQDLLSQMLMLIESRYPAPLEPGK